MNKMAGMWFILYAKGHRVYRRVQIVKQHSDTDKSKHVSPLSCTSLSTGTRYKALFVRSVAWRWSQLMRFCVYVSLPYSTVENKLQFLNNVMYLLLTIEYICR